MNDNIIRDKNIKECLELCLSLSDNSKLQKALKEMTHEQRVVFLLDNGFEWPVGMSIKEMDALEEEYRKIASEQDK